MRSRSKAVRPNLSLHPLLREDAAVPDDTPGELVLRATDPYAFMTGYLGMPDETLAATRNMWFHTGDRVIRQEDGRFHFVDRIKDVIRQRGPLLLEN